MDIVTIFFCSKKQFFQFANSIYLITNCWLTRQWNLADLWISKMKSIHLNFPANSPTPHNTQKSRKCHIPCNSDPCNKNLRMLSKLCFYCSSCLYEVWFDFFTSGIILFSTTFLNIFRYMNINSDSKTLRIT